MRIVTSRAVRSIGNSVRSRAALAVCAARVRLATLLSHGRVRCLPHDDGDQDRDTRRADCGEQALAQLAAGEPAQRAVAPRFEQGQPGRDAECGDQARPHDRIIGEQALLQPGRGTQGVAGPHTAVERAEQHDGDQAGGDEHAGREQEEGQQPRVSVPDLRGGDQPECDDVEDGDEVPVRGEVVLQAGEYARAAAPGVQPPGEGVAGLHHHDDQHGVHRQRHQLDEHVMRRAVKAEQQPDLRGGVAEHGDRHQPPDPALDEAGPVVVALDQPQSMACRRDEHAGDGQRDAADDVGVDDGQDDAPGVGGGAERGREQHVADGGEDGDRHQLEQKCGHDEGQAPQHAPRDAQAAMARGVVIVQLRVRLVVGNRFVGGHPGVEEAPAGCEQPPGTPFHGPGGDDDDGELPGRVDQAPARGGIGGRACQPAPEQRHVTHGLHGGFELSGQVGCPLRALDQQLRTDAVGGHHGFGWLGGGQRPHDILQGGGEGGPLAVVLQHVQHALCLLRRQLRRGGGGSRCGRSGCLGS